MRSLLIRCYPRSWRDRYGDEFAAVLEDRHLGPYDVADVLLAAIDAHLHLRGLAAASVPRGGFVMSQRIGGYAAVIAGVLWLATLVGNAINNGAESNSILLPLLMLSATVATLLALVGLSAFQARKHPVLVWAAFAIPAIGAVVSLSGWLAMIVTGNSDVRMIGDIGAWMVMSIGVLTLMVGSALFAIATWLARSLSRRAAAVLGIGSVLVIPALTGLAFGWLPDVLAYAAVLIAILAFPVGWMGLGVSALRSPRPASFSTPV
jgi:hypothetical protein